MDDSGGRLPEPVTAREVDYGGLEHATGFLLRLAQLRVFDYFYRVLGPQDLRLGTISALILIRHNPGIRHGVLAEALSIRLAHTTKLLKSLESQGLVLRMQGLHDRRSVQLRLTDAGEALVARMQDLIGRHEDLSVGGLNERERRQLKRLLRKFVGIADLSRNDPGAGDATGEAPRSHPRG
jgi:DNA-binding MarR family transcriptional regulator